MGRRLRRRGEGSTLSSSSTARWFGGDGAPVAARTRGTGRGRASGSWAGQAGEVGRPAGMGRSPRGGQGLSHPFSFSFPFSFLKLFCFSYFRPLRHLGKMLDHHQYYQKNIVHMMNILVFMSGHFEIHLEFEFEFNWNFKGVRTKDEQTHV